MPLSDKDIRARLLPLDQVGLGPRWLELVERGDTPEELEKALEKGHIIIDPFPHDLDSRISQTTIDLDFGSVIEVTKVPFETATINGRRTIRRRVFDIRDVSGENLIVHTHDLATRDGGARIRIELRNDETFELPTGLLVCAYTKQCLCVPHDLRASLQGRSTFSRRGVATHMTSDRFDAGWIGYMTMEIVNNGGEHVNLFPGLPFAAVEFWPLSSPVEVPYYKKKGARWSGQH